MVLEARAPGPQHRIGLVLQGTGIAQPAFEPFVRDAFNSSRAADRVGGVRVRRG